MKYLGLIALAALIGGAASAAEPAKLKKVTTAEAVGSLLAAPDVLNRVYAGIPTSNAEILSSPDKKMTIGVYRLEKGMFGKPDAAAAPLTEFIFVLKGQLRLASADGDVVLVGPGESVSIPVGWRGALGATQQTTYFYVINDGPQARP